MSKAIMIVMLLFSVIAVSQSVEFSDKALSEKLLKIDDTQISFKEVLSKHKGKVILIDVWASWCPDCIKGLPKLKELQEKNKDFVYLFLSYDKTKTAWLNGIEKYDIKGEHYLITSPWKGGDFSAAISLDWIPRYILVDKTGKIALFKAIEASDKELLKTIKKIK